MANNYTLLESLPTASPLRIEHIHDSYLHTGQRMRARIVNNVLELTLQTVGKKLLPITYDIYDNYSGMIHYTIIRDRHVYSNYVVDSLMNQPGTAPYAILACGNIPDTLVGMPIQLESPQQLQCNYFKYGIYNG